MNKTDAAGWLTALHLSPKLSFQSLPAWLGHFAVSANDASALIEALRLAYPRAGTSLTATESLLHSPLTADWPAVRLEMAALQESRALPETRPFALTACVACQVPCAYGQIMGFSVLGAPGLVGGLLQAKKLNHPQAMREAAQHLVNLQLPVEARLSFTPQMAGDLAYCLLAHCLGDEIRSVHKSELHVLNRLFRGEP